MTVYRSGLRHPLTGRPWALALGGHSLVLRAPALGATLGAGQLPLEGRAAPAIFGCVQCHVLLPGWAITEGFYPRPCTGRVRALGAGE